MERVITKETLVPIGLVATVLVTLFGILFGAHSWWGARLDVLSSQLESIDRRLERIEEHQVDRWTLTDMRLWAASVRQANPSLTLPEPQQARPVARPPR